MRENRTPNSRTSIHRRLVKFVEQLNLYHREEEQFGSYFVDVYLPEFHVGLEADGPYHWKKRDMKRDEIIFNDYQLPILRIAYQVLDSNKFADVVKAKIVEFIEDYGKGDKGNIDRPKAIDWSKF